jgi:predicted HTH transcriptional regulator
MKEKNNILLYVLGLLAGLIFSFIYKISTKKNREVITKSKNNFEKKVDEREEKIINYVQRYGRINTKKCKEIMGVSEATANRALSNMFQREILLRGGAGRGIFYYLKNINN